MLTIIVRWTFLNLLFIFLVGCSTNTPLNTLSNDIKISKHNKILFYVYLNSSESLTKISKYFIKPSHGEEVIFVYDNGYYPNYPIYSTEVYCGYALDGIRTSSLNRRYGSRNFCNSHYIQMTNNSKISKIVFGVLSAGIIPLMEGKLYRAEFSKKKFRESISKLQLPKIKNIILKNPELLNEEINSDTFNLMK